MRRVLTLFGTRPEVIKLAPVIRELESRPDRFRSWNVTSAQHTDLLYPFTEALGIRIDRDLAVMREAQSPAGVASRVLAALDPLLAAERPDAILVQGDTTTAMAGAMAGFLRQVPVGHVEAGLRSGDPRSPFPEEMNRRLITRLAERHFAATPANVETLLAEGVDASAIALTGNPVVDSLRRVLADPTLGSDADERLADVGDRRLVVLTTHRRESFGGVLEANLRVLRDWVATREDVFLVFPVHPNPAVRSVAEAVLGSVPRVKLLEPLDYFSFVRLLARAWLIVSDSGGVQEEAPSLGKPLLVLRENTERPEGLEAGVAKLVGGDPERLRALLHELVPDHPWFRRVAGTRNPFGRGDAGIRIVDALEDWLGVRARAATSAAGNGA